MSDETGSCIIGLDFGNFNTFVSVIPELNLAGRLRSETPIDLVPARSDGYPSVYFFSNQNGEERELLCEDAVSPMAGPADHRIRYLKQKMWQKIRLDNREIPCDDMIRKVIEKCVREANRILYEQRRITTNEVALAYPATFLESERAHLVELVEQAQMEDGKRVHVAGTIPEPAAAALNFTAVCRQDEHDRTVFVYDLGGWTFDTCLLYVYPKGRRTSTGREYFYEILDIGGLPDVGGRNFNEVLEKILQKKLREEFGEKADRPVYQSSIHRQTEKYKRDLSEVQKITLDSFIIDGELSESEVTREEFEEASHELIQRTIEETKQLLSRHPDIVPDYFVLTGGASRMPMVQSQLQRAFPDLAEKMDAPFQPDSAIARGAAGFATLEPLAVMQKLPHDIGIRMADSEDENVHFVETVLKRDTVLPADAELKTVTPKGNRRSRYCIMEAVRPDPDRRLWESDYRMVRALELDHGMTVPEDTTNRIRIRVDRKGILHFEAEDLTTPGHPKLQEQVQLIPGKK